MFYGNKAKIGLIIPSPNDVMEPEFNAMKPYGVSVHATRVLGIGSAIEDLEKMAEGLEEAARLLATAEVNIIAYGCTSGSFVKGTGWDKELISRIERTTSIPATTTSTAVINAFKELRIGKVALATPYREETNRLEKEFFGAHGVKVVNMKGLGLIQHAEFTRMLPETMYKLACEVNVSEADAVFISCTESKTITVVEKLEKDLQKYVFSSNTATMWDVLKRLDIHTHIKGYGKLFEHL